MYQQEKVWIILGWVQRFAIWRVRPSFSICPFVPLVNPLSAHSSICLFIFILTPANHMAEGAYALGNTNVL
jgi:hypothetical protein